jgi:hypothetical protein
MHKNATVRGQPGRPQAAGADSPPHPRGISTRRLEELVLHLYQIQSAVEVSAAALRRQNCELDADIANVLQRSVADKLQDQIERLEEALWQLGPPASRGESRYNARGQQ